MTPEAEAEFYRRLATIERELAVLGEQMSTIRDGLRSIRELPIKVAEMISSVERCMGDTNYLRKQIEKRNEEREDEREQSRKEKKSDRRWLVGTSLTTGGLILAALGFLLDKF